MQLPKFGILLICGATLLLGLGGFVQPSRALTTTVAATIKFVNPAIVGKSSDFSVTPLPAPFDAAVFMDSYGMTWIQQGDVLQGAQGHPATITIADSKSQFINFLTGNFRFNPGLEPLKVICSTHTAFDNNCSHLLAPDDGKNQTIYLGMNMLVRYDSRDKSDEDTMVVANAPSSLDVTVVFQ